MKERKEAEANEETGEISHYWFTRVYTVFHVSQVEGLNVPEVEKELPAAFNYKHADEFVRRTGIRCLIRAGAVPSYSVSKDLIIMPPLREFNSQEEYIQAKLHELGHASGAKERLNRLEQCKFGDQIYAFEELTVELCAAFLGAHLGVPIRKVQHAEYLKHWIDALRAKPQILWSASTKAQSAFDYLLRLGGEEVPFEQVPMAVNQ
jgi:antirestriction protein ArdC